MDHNPNLSACPVCLGEVTTDQKLEYLENYNLDDKVFSLFRCPKCQVKFWHPFKNPGPEWYKNCKQNLRHRDFEDKEYFIWLSENRAITKHFLKNPPAGKNLLDVACGTGGFLLQAKKLGFEVVGVDFDSEQVAVAKSFGLGNVHEGDVVEFLSNHKEEFDVVTGFEIIEHVDEPRKFLEALRGALKPGGTLCLSTPNNNRMGPKNEFWDFPYHHLTRWTKKSLGNIVALEKFENIKIKEELPIPYLVSKFRFGLGAFIRRKSSNKSEVAAPIKADKSYKDAVSRLGSIKDKVLSVLLYPVAIALFVFGKKGQGLYLTAKK